MKKKTMMKVLAIFATVLLGVCSGAGWYLSKADKNTTETLKYLPLYEATTDNSHVEYGAFDSVPEAEGIKVELFTGDTFYYNKPIDLRGMSKTDPLVEICVVPQEFGSQDVQTLEIMFTDVYDPQNTVKVEFHECSGVTYMTYVMTAATGQPLTGREHGGKIHRANSYGQWCWMNFSSQLTNSMKSHDKNLIALAYDFEESSVNLYACGSTLTFADFDSSDYFQNVWSGFTTGEVLLSIKCDKYAKTRANFVLQKISGHDLTEEVYVDNVHPDIQVDYEGYEQELPQAVVGKPYKLFYAQAADNLDGFITAKTRVYRNYYMVDRINVSSDGKMFTPTEVGTYYVEYSAIDRFGNTAKKVLEVQAVAETDEVAITFDDGVKNGYAGTLIGLPDVYATGGTGKLSISKTIAIGGKAYEIKDNAFRPLDAGEYIYTVTATDYVGQSQTEMYTIVVTAGDSPVFIDPTAVPKYFLVGKTYVLPVIDAYDYSDLSGRAVKTKIYAVQGGQETEITNGYTPMQEGDVTIVYKADNGKAVATISYAAKTVQVDDGLGNIDMAKYFDVENMSMTKHDDHMVFSATDNRASATYIMPMSRYTSTLEFLVKNEQAGFDKLNIYYYNYYDASKFVKLTYENIGGGNLTFYVNDSKELATSLSFAFNGIYNELTINAKKGIVKADSRLGTKVTLNTYYDGTPLDTDLENCMSYFKMELEGVKSDSAVQFRIIGGQLMSSSPYDIQEPVVLLAEQQVGDLSINSEIVLQPACAYDLLDPNVSAYVSVLDVNGNPLTSMDGVLMRNVSVRQSYRLKFEQYGKFRVMYSAMDSWGNMNTVVGFTINVIYESAPVITLEDDVIQEITLGEEVYLPKMTVTDNCEGAINAFVYVVTSKGNYYTITQEMMEVGTDGFAPKYTGVYYVRYVAVDANGNMTIKQYEVRVVAETDE
ncbi:MAG: hypothetical protein IKA88_03615 [Clostridia bacterium]|nr:hypothetical protein [Clostridia bacterium]